ncbi:hypothetical protein Tco_1274606 [Tanacetum coccineum]
MESLHISFQRVVDAGMFHGIDVGGLVNLSHMFYADDAVFIDRKPQATDSRTRVPAVTAGLARKLSPTSGTMGQRTLILLAEEIDEEEEYPFVNKYPSFQEECIVLVEEESCLIYDIDSEEEESMPFYDTDIEDVIEEEE